MNLNWLKLEFNVQRRKLHLWQILVGIILIISFGFWTYYTKSTHGLLKITVFDVGQGDAILIRTPSDLQVLIDGGPDNTIIQKLSQELPFWDRNLDLIVLTHPHADHLSGLLEVAERYKIDQIMITDFEYSSAEFRAWQDFLEKFQENLIYAKAGQKIKLESGLEIEILYPEVEFAEKDIDNPNNTSIVFRVDYGYFSMLFTGDAECEEQEKILGQDLDIEVLKVPHQGAKDAACEEFIKSTNPNLAIISVGADNQFGHPHIEHLGLLTEFIPDQFGQEIFRTDQNGDISIFSDQQNYWIKTEK